tara:strand:- start:394 stop:681 length:288 start_codon:yes stop_codon:yes gene_type:complete
MIVRIVKLSINKNHRNNFIDLFNDSKSLILTSEGCEKVQLLKDDVNEEIFFTYSHWKNIESLEKYRNSTTFKSIWKKTKTYFCDKPEAWSLKHLL